MRKLLMAVLALCCASIESRGQEKKPEINSPQKQAAAAGLDAKWGMLAGDWLGEGAGSPGKGAGTCSFQFDLQRCVMIRHNHSEYPPSGGKPAIVHDDLMVIYPGSEGEASRAIYFDSEGHVIEYSAAWSAAGDTVTFASKPMPNTPQYRLFYKKLDAQTLTIAFEIAPPGQPGAFKPYLSGRLVRSERH